ncbi:GTPase [Rothia nasimurium]|uniref:GTPase n=1 Tax=Rothia nasimurium TaxID=85336 RepID=UPI003BA1F0CF
MAKEEASPKETPEELDPEFEAALTAALALEPTERIDRLKKIADDLKKELD